MVISNCYQLQIPKEVLKKDPKQPENATPDPSSLQEFIINKKKK